MISWTSSRASWITISPQQSPFNADSGASARAPDTGAFGFGRREQSRCWCGRAEPSRAPVPVVAGVGPVPVQVRQGAARFAVCFSARTRRPYPCDCAKAGTAGYNVTAATAACNTNAATLCPPGALPSDRGKWLQLRDEIVSNKRKSPTSFGCLHRTPRMHSPSCISPVCAWQGCRCRFMRA